MDALFYPSNGIAGDCCEGSGALSRRVDVSSAAFFVAYTN